MSSNVHGFSNENEISDYLNEHSYKNYNDNMKTFINYIVNKENIIKKPFNIDSYVITSNQYKADINLTINQNSFGVSIKEGSGNSVHQENISDFLSYLSNKLSAPQNIIDNFDWFINSKDGARTLKRKAPKKIKILKNFLNDNKRQLIRRFLQTGLTENNYTDYIYYGNYKNGVWGEINEVIEYVANKSRPRATLPVGNLTIQAWNRTNENKRHVLQVKWGQIENDLSVLKEGV